MSQAPDDGEDDDPASDEPDAASDELEAAGSNIASFGFQQTLFTGHYTQELSDFARHTAEEQRIHQALLKKKSAQQRNRKRMESNVAYRCFARLQRLSLDGVHRVGADWVLLIIIGVTVAVIGYLMDFVASLAYRARMFSFDAAADVSVWLQYGVWIFYHSSFCMLGAGIVHIVNPQAAGSGMPEMKAILGGVELHDFLSWKSMFAKFFAGCAAMSSGLPFGKGGILACISACITHMLCKRFVLFQGIYQNETRRFEMLAAAVAVAIACTFASPVSGVLFSVELTATFFEVQNYWRAFFCTICGTTVFRLIAVFVQYEMTISSLVKTTLNVLEFPYDILEFIPFSVIGVVCGVGGALFVFTHRGLILFVRSQKKLSAFLQRNRLLYPFAVSALVATLTFPPLLGQFCGGRLNTRLVVTQLFSDKAFTLPLPETASDEEVQARVSWSHPQTGVFVNLALYTLTAFLTGALAYTVAVPFGTFTAVWAIGAAMGRLAGEAMATWFPDGISTGYGIYKVTPGGYAIVGAAALSGGVLHSISVALTLHEMTGQVNYLLPSLWATMIANMVAKALMPSMFDSIIQMKKIPFLPIFKPATSRAHYVYAEDIMQKDPKVISLNSTYDELTELLVLNPFVFSYPLVDSPETRILIGSVQRNHLIDLLELHLRRKPRVQVDSVSESEPTASATAVATAAHSNRESSQSAKETRQSKRSLFSLGQETLQRRTQAAAAADGDSSSRSPSTTPVDQVMPVIRVSAHTTDDDDDEDDGDDDEQISPLEEAAKRAEAASRKRRESSTSITLSSGGLFGRRRRSTGGAKMPRSNSDVGAATQHIHEELQKLQEEEERMCQRVDFKDVHIDPAPFQVSQKTSLHKIHSLFVLLRLSQAYVTHQGRLVGQVTIKEVQEELSHPLVHQSPYKKVGKQRKTASATIGGGDKGMAIIMPEEG